MIRAKIYQHFLKERKGECATSQFIFMSGINIGAAKGIWAADVAEALEEFVSYGLLATREHLDARAKGGRSRIYYRREEC